MSFLTALALLVGVAVVAPYLAHRLRRRRSDDRPFAFVRFVPSALPQARRRSKLEDRALFGLRAISILLLALLGATPLVRCSRLSLDRGGASVALAIVVDDSMSMRAKDGKDKTRFARAIDGARQLLASTREGDAVAIVLAGAPPRVALSASTDLGAASSTLDTLTPSDRATDIDGAVSMARSLVANLPQQDKRIVLLSDLADGTDKPLPDDPGLWVPLADLPSAQPDCAVLTADRSQKDVHVEIGCGPQGSALGRELTLTVGEQEVARVKAPAGSRASLSIPLDPKINGDVVVALTPGDAIAEDDVAPAVQEASQSSIGVMGDRAQETAATGGAPIVEQALSALETGLDIRPLADLPDKAVDLAPFAGLLFDDPPGFTPESRRVLEEYFARGGVVLLALGPAASRAPLGAAFLPMIDTIPSWETTKATGAKAATTGPLGDAAQSLVDLDPKGRAVLTDEDSRALTPWLLWNDDAMFLGRREIGKGEAYVLTLPLAPGESDLPLRPGFLAILDSFVSRARARSTPRRSEAGATFPVADGAKVQGPHGAVALGHEGDVVRLTVPDLGRYVITTGDRTETRVVAPIASELDLRPRPTAGGGHAKIGGGPAAKLDASWIVALVLLALFFGEIVLRAFTPTEPADMR